MNNNIKIVGVQKCDFNNGDGANGTLLHCAFKSSYTDGVNVIRFFVFDSRVDSFPPLEVGKEYNASYHKSKSTNSYVLDSLL